MKQSKKMKLNHVENYPEPVEEKVEEAEEEKKEEGDRARGPVNKALVLKR